MLSLPKSQKQPGLGQAEPGARHSIQVSHIGYQGPNYLSHHLLLPPRVYTGTKLELGAEARNSNPGIPKWDVGTLTTG